MYVSQDEVDMDRTPALLHRYFAYTRNLSAVVVHVGCWMTDVQMLAWTCATEQMNEWMELS